MRIRYALPDVAVRPDVLDAALEVSTRANQAMLRSDATRPISEAIRRGLVEWRPERFTDGEHFDLAHTVNNRGWGDCDDLAPALAAELRETGRDPEATAIVKRTGPTRWHAVVHSPRAGRILDPSRWAGMGKRRPIRGRGLQRRIVSGAAALGIKRAGRAWAARCDLPIMGTPMHVCGQAIDRDLGCAVSRAISGAATTGAYSEAAHPRAIQRALAWDAALNGEDVEGEYDEREDDIGFLPLAAALAPTALSMASKLIPGGGGGGGKSAPAPAAAAAPVPGAGITATPSGGGGPVSISPYGPGGPIIVRF